LKDNEPIKHQRCSALLATAQNSIKMPKADFTQLGIHLSRKISDLRNEGIKMIGGSPCEFYDLGNLTLTIDQMDYVIPSQYYSQTEDGQCHFLFEVNNDDQSDLKDKYIIGLPFLQAFIVVLDYEQNTVGFANKQNNLGAEILGAGAPGPNRDYYTPRDFEEYERDETFIPVDIDGNPTDGWVRPSDTSKSSDYGLTPLLTDVIWGFIVFMLIFLLCKYAKIQKSKA
jgi:hypothetical protein